ncbi:MAG: hypothetical protein QNL54_14790 [Rhodobacterales bacterium]
MDIIIRALAAVARNGRIALVIGLIAGLSLPNVAQILRPWLPQMIAALLFLTAFRIGPNAALGGLADGLSTLKVALLYQVVTPLVALAVFWAVGVSATPFAIAILLMLSAPSVTGSPNLTILLGHNPEPAFRILIIGTAILPLTIIPIFWLSPALGDLSAILIAAFRLLGAIALSVSAAFLLRKFVAPAISSAKIEALDGVMAIALAVIVVGLMAALGPALKSDPVLVLKWLAVALIANLGLQYIAFTVMRLRGKHDVAVPFGIVAGNRNFALFLIALPAATTEPLLIFLGCYQVPMYLTAILMRRVYARHGQ